MIGCIECKWHFVEIVKLWKRSDKIPVKFTDVTTLRNANRLKGFRCPACFHKRLPTSLHDVFYYTVSAFWNGTAEKRPLNLGGHPLLSVDLCSNVMHDRLGFINHKTKQKQTEGQINLQLVAKVVWSFGWIFLVLLLLPLEISRALEGDRWSGNKIVSHPISIIQT